MRHDFPKSDITRLRRPCIDIWRDRDHADRFGAFLAAYCRTGAGQVPHRAGALTAVVKICPREFVFFVLIRPIPDRSYPPISTRSVLMHPLGERSGYIG